MNNYVYLRLEKLTGEEAARHKVKADAKIPRLDMKGQTGYYEPLKAFMNPKGMIFFYVTGTDMINASNLRRTDVRLQSNGINLSSIYWMDAKSETELIGYGNPADVEYFKPKMKKRKDGTVAKVTEMRNPFYNNRKDGFMFLCKPDMSAMEMVIVLGGRYTMQSECRRYIDGEMDDVMKSLRDEARPIFNY